MKANTNVFIAARNIGDSSDSGQFFDGELKNGILWLAAYLGGTTMAGRIVIGIGRDAAGARQAIELKRGLNTTTQIELASKLDKIFADGLDSDDSTASAPASSRHL